MPNGAPPKTHTSTIELMAKELMIFFMPDFLVFLPLLPESPPLFDFPAS
jgi:hypothetical protein